MSHKQIKVEDMTLKWGRSSYNFIYAVFVISWFNLVKNLGGNIQMNVVNTFYALKRTGLCRRGFKIYDIKVNKIIFADVGEHANFTMTDLSKGLTDFKGHSNIRIPGNLFKQTNKNKSQQKIYIIEAKIQT